MRVTTDEEAQDKWQESLQMRRHKKDKTRKTSDESRYKWGGTRQVMRVTTNEEAQERQVTRVTTNEEAQDKWWESLQMRRHKTSDESHYKWGSTRKTSDESYYKWGSTRQVMRVTTNEEAQDKWRELLQGRRTTYAACMSQNSNLGAIEVNLTICWIAAENFFASLTLTCDENVAG